MDLKCQSAKYLSVVDNSLLRTSYQTWGVNVVVLSHGKVLKKVLHETAFLKMLSHPLHFIISIYFYNVHYEDAQVVEWIG